MIGVEELVVAAEEAAAGSHIVPPEVDPQPVLAMAVRSVEQVLGITSEIEAAIGQAFVMGLAIGVRAARNEYAPERVASEDDVLVTLVLRPENLDGLLKGVEGQFTALKLQPVTYPPDAYALYVEGLDGDPVPSPAEVAP